MPLMGCQPSGSEAPTSGRSSGPKNTPSAVFLKEAISDRMIAIRGARNGPGASSTSRPKRRPSRKPVLSPTIAEARRSRITSQIWSFPWWRAPREAPAPGLRPGERTPHRLESDDRPARIARLLLTLTMAASASITQRRTPRVAHPAVTRPRAPAGRPVAQANGSVGREPASLPRATSGRSSSVA